MAGSHSLEPTNASPSLPHPDVWGEAIDSIRVVVFLVGYDGGWVDGEVLRVKGGVI